MLYGSVLLQMFKTELIFKYIFCLSSSFGIFFKSCLYCGNVRSHISKKIF